MQSLSEDLDTIPEEIEFSEGFRVCDEASADWCLERMQELDLLRNAEELRKAAIVANIDTRIAQIDRRRAWLQTRFGPQLAEWAKANLPKRGKTVTLDHGKIAFRTTQGSIEVTDMVAAVAWAKKNFPDAVKREVKEWVVVTPLQGVPALPATAFRVTDPREKATIDTSIGKPAEIAGYIAEVKEIEE